MLRRFFIGLVLVGSACDRGGESSKGEAEAKSKPAEGKTADVEATEAKSEAKPLEPAAKADSDKPEPEPEPEPAPEPAPEKDEFEAHVAKLLADTGAKPGADPGKEAWAHYKAKRHAKAVPLFGAAALAKPDAYKPAFNMACAAALAGDGDSSRIALAEALERDRATVTTKANKDSDLASVRGEAWFSELLAERPTPDEPEPDDPDDPIAKLESSWYGKNCSDLDPHTKSQRCWDEFLVGEYAFEALSFETTLPLPELPEPGSMPKSRIRRVKAKLDFKAIAGAIGARGVFGLDPDKCEAPERLPEVYDDDCPFYRPFYWWPADDQVLLVIPHTVRRSPVTARTVTIAKQVDGQWKSTTIDSLLDDGFNTHLVGGSWELLSGPILRGDGRELWTFAEGFDGDSGNQAPYLCRIRWETSKLHWACRVDWEHQFSAVYPG